MDGWDTHNGLDPNVDLGIAAAAGKPGFKFALLEERGRFHQEFEDDRAMQPGHLGAARTIPPTWH